MRDAVPTEIPEGWREWNEVDELRAELQQAVYTVEFLHGCLTDPIFKYAYPEQTLAHLDRWRPMVENAPHCTAETARHPPGICPFHHRLMPDES